MTRNPRLSRAVSGAVALMAASASHGNLAHGENIKKWNPPTLFDSRDFSHLAEVGQINTLVFIAGLGPQDARGRIDKTARIRGQTRAVLRNLKAALDAVGATPDDVVRIHIHVVGYRMMEGMIVSRQLRRFFGGRMPVSSFIPVDRLLWDGARVQIDAEVALNQGPGARSDGQ